MIEMRLAANGESTFGLVAWPNNPAVLLGRIAIETPDGIHECTLAAGNYPKSDCPTLFIQPDPDTNLNPLSYSFEPNEYESAGNICELLEFMEKAVVLGDLEIIGFTVRA